MADETAIWWIRRDIRLRHNEALSLAATRGRRVLPVFIVDPQLVDSSRSSKKQIEFMFDSLRELDRDLRSVGG